jgi:hypothetical protein
LIFASLYQDKEVKKRGKIIEQNTIKDSFRGLSCFFSNNMYRETLKGMIKLTEMIPAMPDLPK